MTNTIKTFLQKELGLKGVHIRSGKGSAYGMLYISFDHAFDRSDRGQTLASEVSQKIEAQYAHELSYTTDDMGNTKAMLIVQE